MIKPTKPHQVWVSDIIYMPLRNSEWRCRPGYLCIWMDLFTRVIVSWSVDNIMQESLVRETLEKALLKRKIQPSLIVHSDRGGQYLSDKMKELVHPFGLKQSDRRTA